MRRMIFGCGYLGRRVAAQWHAAGDDVFALTRSKDNAETLRQVGITPILGDVTDARSLEGLPEFDTVLHAVGFDRSASATRREVYVDGLANVLEAVSGRSRHFIHVSSTSVYGQQNEEAVNETSACEPASESGAICLEAEKLVLSSQLEKANVLRLSGIYGPGRLLSRIEGLKAGLPLPGEPEAWLNLIHVDDATSAVQACEERGIHGDLYLVSDDQPIRRRKYYETLASLVDAPAPTFDPQASARHTHGLGKRCVNRKLRDELGVELSYPNIEVGLKHAIADAKV